MIYLSKKAWRVWRAFSWLHMSFQPDPLIRDLLTTAGMQASDKWTLFNALYELQRHGIVCRVCPKQRTRKWRVLLPYPDHVWVFGHETAIAAEVRS